MRGGEGRVQGLQGGSVLGESDIIVKIAMGAALVGAALGTVGAGMIWGVGGVLLFIGLALLLFGLSAGAR
jgi:hypothetical protein